MQLGVFGIREHQFLREYLPEFIDVHNAGQRYECDVLLWNNNFPFSPQTLERFPNLKLLINWGIEDANLQLEDILRSKVKVKKVESYAHQAMAEFALMLILQFERSQGVNARNLHGKKVGIIGLGRLGFTLANVLYSSFHCDISYNARTDYQLPHFSFKDPAEIFDSCDIAILTPRAKTTALARSMLDVAHPNLLIVNIARDSVLPFRIIEPCIRSGKIRGFVGDVVDSDTITQTDSRILIAPKIGYKTQESIALKRNIVRHYLKQYTMRESNSRSSVFVARHGQSKSNADGVYDGQRDSLLTEEGHRQAKSAALFLQNKSIEGIFSSPLGRAQETAEIISRAIGIPVTTIPYFEEMHFGIFQGQHRQHVMQLFPDFFSSRSRSPHAKLYTPYPGGESYFDVYSRVLSPTAELLAKRNNFVIVGHESVNRIIRGIVLNKLLIEMIHDKQKNGEMVEIDLTEESEKIHSI